MLRLFVRALAVSTRNAVATCDCVITKNNVSTKYNCNSLNLGPQISTFRRFCTESQNQESSSFQEPISESLILEAADGNPKSEHDLRVLLLQIDLWREQGDMLPHNTFLKTQHLKELLKAPSRSAQRKYLLYLFKLEKKKENQQKKKVLKQLERGTKPEVDIDFSQDYALGKNNFMLRIYDTTLNNFYNHRLIRAMMFGQKIVIDCGYHQSMNLRENKSCAKQLMLLFSENRAHDEPFDIHFCNVDRNSYLMESLHQYIGTMYEPWFPLSLHESSYLDIFPKEKLVYLTPHCRETLTTFNHDDIYIVGALVDKVNNDPLSLAKAKSEGIRVAKLPLDQHLLWGAGSGKSLTLNQVVSIMLDVKQDGDWKNALKHVPKRKLADVNLEQATKKFHARVGIFKNNETIRPSRWSPKHFEETKSQQRLNRKKRILTLYDILNEDKN